MKTEINPTSVFIGGKEYVPADSVKSIQHRGDTTNQNTDGTMNTQATERINGYCCEVTQEQWEELVMVASRLEVLVSNTHFETGIRYAQNDGRVLVFLSANFGEFLIPFSDFLAKLRGDEVWQPKAGEMVEVSDNNKDWYAVQYIATRKDVHVCWINDESAYTRFYRFIRPIRPTITRAEAEKELSKQINDKT